jgi:site-specific recombinase XerD
VDRVNQLQQSDLRSFSADWIAKGQAKTTLAEYVRHLNLFFEAHPGAYTLTDAREYSNELLGRSASQGRFAVRALKAFDSWRSTEYDEPPRLTKLRTPKDPTPDPTRTQVATAAQVETLLASIRESADEYALRDHAIVSVLFSTGMRRSELAGMDRVPSGGGLSGVMPGVAQVPVVMPVAEVVSVSRVPSSSANDVSVR